MDKLTRTGQDFENEFCSGCDCVYYGEPYGCNSPDGECESYHYFTQLADRLAEYEDTGLTPSEVAELAQAKADGRVVVLPCAVGDTVYVDKRILFEGWRTEGVTAKIAVGKVVSFRKNGNGVFLKIRFTLESMEGSLPYMRSYAVSAIGKTVFLSREEAEKALKECDE